MSAFVSAWQSSVQEMHITYILMCILSSSCCLFQSVHVGAAREHPETLRLPVGDFHHLLRPAVQTAGLYDWWVMFTKHLFDCDNTWTQSQTDAELVEPYSLSLCGEAVGYLHIDLIHNYYFLASPKPLCTQAFLKGARRKLGIEAAVI